MNNESELLKNTVSLLFPLIVITAIYVIINGADAPGGGFQGGAILSAIFIIKYYVSPFSRSDVKQLGNVEKYVLLLTFSVIIGFMYFGLNVKFSELNPHYILISNILIAAKVFFSFGIIFYRFLYFDN